MSLGADNQYTALADSINDTVTLRYHSRITLVQYPSQGDFAWCFQNADGLFNQWTLDYLSARALPGDEAGLARLSDSGGLPRAQSRLLSDLDFRLSSADQRTADPALAGTQLRANAELARIRAATDSPDAGSGGLTTIDPLSGARSTSCQPAFTVRTPLAAIANGLSDDSSTIVAAAPGPAGSTVTFTYSGVVMVATGPLAWQPSTGQGWHCADHIAEAFHNGQDDVTGYAFRSAPPFAPGPISSGGTLGWITGLLLSRPPKLTVHPASSTPSGPMAATLLAGGASPLAGAVLDSFSLLGLGLPEGIPYRQGRLTRSSGAPDADSSPPLAAGSTILVPEPTPSVPVLQSTAYVVGAVIQGA